MKTTTIIKGLGISALSLFLMLFSVTVNSQSCIGNSITATIQNITQTNTTVEFDVYLKNTGTTTMRLAAFSSAITYNAGFLPFGATGTFTCISNPSANAFPTLNDPGANHTAASNQIRWSNTPVTLASGNTVNMASNADMKFARFRFTSSLPWTANFAGSLIWQNNVVAGYTNAAAVVYCNGNANSAALSSAAAGTMTVGPVQNITLNQSGPSASVLSGGGTYCTTGTANIYVAITGGASPYTLVYSNGSSNFTVTNYTSGSSIAVSPTATTTYSLLSVTDANSNLGVGNSGTATVTVNQPSSSSVTATACDTYTWSANAATYTVGGAYTYTSLNAQGCVNTATLNLTINHNSSNSSTATACDTYTWSANGATYTTSGTYTYTSLNASGCVNTSTLNLTINHSSTSTSSVTACDSYSWSANGVTYTTSGTYTYTSLNVSGCVNTATLNLTIHNSTSSSTTQTSLGTYTWSENGMTYTTSGTYTSTSLSGAGCLNTATLILTIVPNPYACNGDNITATMQNITQTATTIEFDVYLKNTGTTSLKLAAFSAGILYNTGLLPSGATGTFTCISNPSANAFPTLNNPTPNHTPASNQIRWSQSPVTLVSGNTVDMPSNADMKFARFRFTSSLPWTAGFAGSLSWVYNVTAGYTNATAVVYCNGNTSSTGLTAAAAGTMTVGPVQNIILNAGSTSAVLSGGGIYCATGTANLSVAITGGTSPYTIVYTDGTSNFTVNSYTSGSAISVSPSSTKTYNLVSVTDVNGNVGTGNSGIATVTVNQPSSSSSSATACDSYTWSANGITYTASGTYTYTSLNASGCVNTATLTLTINHSTSSSSSVSSTNLYTWSVNGVTYTTSGTYTNTSLNASGCVYTQSLNLTINTIPIDVTIIGQSISCHGANNGSIQTNVTPSGTYTFTLDGGIATNTTGDFTNLSAGIHTVCASNGFTSSCDTVVIGEPTVLSVTLVTDSTVSCHGNDGALSAVITGGTAVNQPYLTIWPAGVVVDNIYDIQVTNLTTGIYTVTVEDDNACMAAATITLGNTMPVSVTATHTSIQCNGGTSVITAIASGGDGTITKTITGGSFTVTVGTYIVTATDTRGCTATTSVVITQPSLITGSSNVTACDSYVFGGSTYTTSGFYAHTFTSASGCDSIHTLNLIINNSTSSSTSITACDSYTWSAYGLTYTSSGTYTKTSLNASGCLNTATLILTINSSTSSSSTITTCDSYTWSASGLTYTASGTYTKTSLNASGCTNTATLILTVNHSSASSSSITACDTYTWSASGLTYTASGTYTKTSLNASGCVNTATLILTINHSTTASSTISATGSYTWSVNGATYTASGTYTATSLNASGCVLTSTLILTINTSSNTTFTVKAYLSGYYTGSGLMRKVLQNQVVSGATTVQTDTVKVELRAAVGGAIIETYKGVISTSGVLSCTFSSAVAGNSYWIAVHHRNSIETWSAATVNITNNGTYDFTTGANKAYASNLKSNGDGSYALFSGDINQDGAIDLSDLTILNSGLQNGLGSVYVASDVNGDGAVDLSDLTLLNVNLQNGVGKNTPY